MLQFRLRTLFVVMTGAAILAWILFVPPGWVGVLILYMACALLPAATVTGIIYHRENRRAFFIGVGVWLALVCVMVWAGPGFDGFLPRYIVGYSPGDQFEVKLLLLVFLVLAFVNGFVAVGMRRWAVSGGAASGMSEVWDANVVDRTRKAVWRRCPPEGLGGLLWWAGAS